MPEKRKLAAILAADVVGFSRLTGADEDRTLARLRALRSDLIDPTIAIHNGRVVKRTGDGALVEFRSVVDAVRCAIEIQNSMVERNAGLPADRKIEFRIGIHLGDVVEESDGDLMGDGVNIAARLEGIAQPGSICLSEDAYRQVKARLDLSVSDLGETKLKNIAEPIRVYSLQVGLSPTVKAATPVEVKSTTAVKPSIAVLPFTNMIGDADQEYFSDGITDDIITELTRNRGLFVIARNSSFTFKGAATNIGEVGRKLGVRYVVEGSVRKAGKRVRITAQLSDAASGSHVWAERYDRDLEDIFAVQDEVTRSITAAIPGYVESDIVKASRRKPTESLGAYDHYLRGREIFYRWRNDDIPEAIAEFESAVRLDPNFGRAHAALGHMHLRVYWQSDNALALERAGKETDLAVRLDDQDSRCWSSRGMFLLTSKEFDGAGDAFQRMFRLSPNEPQANVIMAYYLACVGRANEGIEMCLKAIRSSPLFLPSSHQEFIAMTFMMARQYEEAAKSFAAITSADFYIDVLMAGCLVKIGRVDEARTRSRLATELNPEWPSRDMGYYFKNDQDKEHIKELVQLAINALPD